MSRLLLISNSTLHGSGYLDHAEAEIRDFIGERVRAVFIPHGAPYIGSSAGSIVACPSLKTTKDMPVIQPPSFAAPAPVPFQISPHYLDNDPTSTHMGETQEQRILQFVEENEEPVIGLREGSILRVEGDDVALKGPHSARVFRCGEHPIEAASGSNLGELLFQPSSLAGLVV